MKRVFTSDCEGPISKNDNAFEITAHFVPNGSKLFTVISKYDDVLAHVMKKSGYSAGDTLKLILPFLKAYGVTDKKMREFSAQNLILIANSKETLSHVRSIADAYIISTSYEHYIRALCQALNFPYENAYCTKLNMDKYPITEQEKKRLKELAEEIGQMPIVNIPAAAKSLKDFSAKDQEAVRRLDEIFWNELASTDCGKMFSEVKPVGGGQKAAAIRDSVKRSGVHLADVMYVGDSITDVEAFKLVKDNGGLTVSFNGNGYAVNAAEIAVLSETSLTTAIIADVFCKHGKQQASQLAFRWGREYLEGSVVSNVLLGRLLKLCPDELPKVQIVTAENKESLVKESSAFRKKVRGESVGRLG